MNAPQAKPDLREWLEADGLGGFASGTISGLRTRRYQALLLVATLPPSGRVVLVNGFEVVVESPNGTRTPVNSQRFVPGVTAPAVTAPLLNFTMDPWPTWTYQLPDGKLTQEIVVPRGKAAVVLRWRWESHTSARLRVRPLFSGRDFHSCHHENPVFHFEPQIDATGNHWRFYHDLPEVVAQSNGTYHHEPVWYKGFLYDGEAERGLDSVEDLAAPGVYEFVLGDEPSVLIFSAAGLGEPLPRGDAAWTADTLLQAEQARRSAFPTTHLRAADAYLVARGEGQTIIAGYPWFGDWGRDTFIALRGLCLATGRLREVRDILVAWARVVSQGMLPNLFPDGGKEPEYNSVDASLWYVIDVFEYLRASQGNPVSFDDEALLLGAVDAILTGYHNGTRYGIRGDSDGLLCCGEPGVQLTWMDAKIGDWVVTPRTGKPVEIQALWLNALGLAALRDPKWQPLFDQGCISFQSKFWNESAGCLYDVVDVDHVPGKVDGQIRPNMLFAIGGLPLSLIFGDHARRTVQVAEEKLWTPLGPRSLSPDDPAYAAHYVGGPAQRDAVYHQGTVWPWLAGPFVEAWVRVHGNTLEAKAEARQKFLAPQLMRLDLQGLLHLPEIADAEAPHTERGCPFQAWSLGEIIRLDHQVLV